jgi:hypothetical protein
VEESWSNFEYDGLAAFKLSEWSPLPQAWSAKDLPGSSIQVLSVHQIKQTDHHPAESDGDIAPESIMNNENWLNRNGISENRHESKDI